MAFQKISEINFTATVYLHIVAFIVIIFGYK